MNIKQLLIATSLLLSSAANAQSDFEEMKLLAEQGDARAQSNLGVMYAVGDGAPENDTEAVKSYRLATEQGDAIDQTNLALMYKLGDGVPENYAEAVKWFRLAAEQGDAMTQTILGFHYYGEGVPLNNVRAYVWWSVAAAQGNEDAKTQRDMISEKLTPALLGQAQQIATKCFESDYKDCE